MAKKKKQVKLKMNEQRERIYQNIYDLMAKLKPGKKPSMVVVTPPKGVTLADFHNRLSVSLHRFPVPCPKGYRFVKRQTVDGKLAIMLKKEGEVTPLQKLNKKASKKTAKKSAKRTSKKASKKASKKTAKKPAAKRASKPRKPKAQALAPVASAPAAPETT